MKSDDYGSATLTTRGHARSRFTKTGMPPGMMEGAFGMSAKDLAATYSLEKLQSIRDEIMGDMEQEAEPEGGNIADMYADQLQGVDDAIAIKQGNSIEGRPSYDEVYLKSKLVGFKDAYEYDPDRGIVIFPDLGSLQYRSRSTQEITFTKHKGEIHFVHAFGMTRSYDELKKVLPELPPMQDSSYSGFFNVHFPGGSPPIDLDTAQAMIDAMKKGRDAEASTQSAFYTRQPGTGGTGIDEEIILEISPEEATKKKNTNLKKNIDIDIRLAKATDVQADKGINTQRVQINQQIDQAESAESQAYETRNIAKIKYEAAKTELRRLKVDQDMDPVEKNKLVRETQDLLKQIKTEYDAASEGYIKSKEASQAALKGLSGVSAAASQANKAFQKNLQTLKKQKNQIGRPVKGGQQPIAEILLKQYIRERKHINLIEQMHSYKRTILLENAMQKFFKLFDKGKTDEEVLRYYALSGIVVPEPFIKKARDQYKNLKKAKLDIEFAEQETKDFKSIQKEKPKEIKQIASRLFKEDFKYSTERTFNAPTDLLNTLKTKLKINPINRFIENFKAINSIPPSYRAFLHNGQTFDIVYEEFSLLIKIGTKRYYIADLDERNLAIKHINKLLTGKVIKPEEDEEEIETPPTTSPPKSSPTSPPPSPEDDLDDDL